MIRPQASAASVRMQVESALATRVPGALTVPERVTPVFARTGVAAVDKQTGGIPYNALTEICGPTSSGRTSLLLSVLAALTREQRMCALVDASDVFSPHAGTSAGVDLRRLLWIRCGQRAPAPPRNEKRPKTGKRPPRAEFTRLDQALRATDLLLQSGGFGLVALDFGDIAPHLVRRIPLTTWFRFRRAVEGAQTALVVIGQEASAGTCASLLLQLTPAGAAEAMFSSILTHGCLLTQMEFSVEVARTPVTQRKPMRPASVGFRANPDWNAS